jgi:hypothetical protein
MSNNETKPSPEALTLASLPDLTRQTAKNGRCSQCNHEFSTEEGLKEHSQICHKENGDNTSTSMASNSDLALSNDSPKQNSSDTTNSSRNDTNSNSSNASMNNKARTISPMESAESGDESDNSEFITSPNENKKRKREDDDASDISRAYKLRKKSMSMKEGLFSLLNQTHPDVDFTGDAIISWLPDGKSFVIHNWDRFVITMNRICGQNFKALASNLSKFGFVRQKNKEQNLIQRHYLCPIGFERGGSNVDLKKITSKNKLGGSVPYPFDAQLPAGAFNPAILANPLLYKVQAPSPQLIPQAAVMEANGFVPKELQPLSPNMNGKPMHYNGIIHANNMVPNGPLPVGAPNLNNNINPNNALQSSRDDLPWPKLISLDNKPTRIFTGPFDKRDEAFRINIYTLLTKKSNPACPEVAFTPMIQENCGDLYFTRLRGVPPDGLDWPTTPHTRVIYRTQTGRLQVGGSNQALQDGNVAVMRRHVWKSLCNRFKRHEYVLIDGQQKNKYWNVKEESPVLYCYFRVSDEEGNAPALHVPKLERTPMMNGHEPEMIHFRVDNNPPTMTNSYRSQVPMPNVALYDAKMMDLDSIAEASVKMSQSPLSSSPAPRRVEVPHAPNNIVHGVPPVNMNGAVVGGPVMNGVYPHPTSPTPIMAPSPQNSYSPAPVPKTFTLPFPGSKDPLPINNQMNGGHPNGAILGATEVSNLLAMIENLKQQIKAMEVIKESQRINYEKQVFDLTLENQNLKKQLDLMNSKLGQVLNSFNGPMVDGMVPPRGFNPAILAALQQTAMAHNGGIIGASSPAQPRSTQQSN